MTHGIHVAGRVAAKPSDHGLGVTCPSIHDAVIGLTQWLKQQRAATHQMPIIIPAEATATWPMGAISPTETELETSAGWHCKTTANNDGSITITLTPPEGTPTAETLEPWHSHSTI